MKVRAKHLTKQQKIETLDALYTAVSTLKSRGEMKMFLRDLLTESERIMLGRRIIIARRIIAGDTDRQISRELGVGLDTIARVSKWLDDQFPGYEKALSRMHTELIMRKRKSAPVGSFAFMKQRYPLHYLLFPWPKGYRNEDGA